MFEEYSSEIIAFIAIIILCIIYEIIKFRTAKNSKKQKIYEHIEKNTISKENSTLKLDKYNDDNDIFHDVLHDEIKEKFKKQRKLEEQKEHSTIKELVIEQETEKKLEEEVPSCSIEKRSVPPHGKITKDDFKEFSGNRILIAEDNIINQKVLKGLLADSGIEIAIANDGQEALDILENDRDFLMILMDAHMPRVDGFEATQTIRKNSKYDKILIVALSGDTATDDIKKMKKAGMDEYLEKPLKIDEFYNILYAYSVQSVETNIPISEPFNIEVGLQICGGDEKFYSDILNEFLEMYRNSAHELKDFLDTEKYKEADKLLLDIIGVTANIGAESLNKTASTVKIAIINKDKKEYLKLVTLYEQQLDNLISDIKNYHIN